MRFIVGILCTLAAVAVCLVAYIYKTHKDHTLGPAPNRERPLRGPLTGPPQTLTRKRGPKKAASPGKSTPEAIARANLLSLLARLQNDRREFAQREVIQQARERIDEFSDPLLEILDDDKHILILPAIELSAAVRVFEATSLLEALTYCDEPGTRAAAILAVEALGGWRGVELEGFLLQREPLVLIAALQVFSRRHQRPVDRIVPLLAHDDARVRKAAVAAMSTVASGQELTSLCELARRSQGRVAAACAEALGRAGISSREAELCLNELLARSDFVVRQAVLRALATKKAPLLVPQAVLAHVRDPERVAEEKAAGFIALEKTRTLPVDQLQPIVESARHPVTKLLAARCLVSAGNRSAVLVLIELLECQQTKTVDDEAVDCARQGAREVLIEVSGRDYGDRAAAWMPWYRTLGSLGPRTLASRPPAVW